MEDLFNNLDDPRRQALLMMAAGLLSPVRGKGMAGFGEAMSRGIEGGLLGFNQAATSKRQRERDDIQKQMLNLQLGNAKSEQDFNSRRDALARNFFEAPTPSVPYNDTLGNQPPQANTSGSPGKADLSGYAAALPSLGGKGVTEAIQIQQALQKDNPFGKVDPKDHTPESLQAFMASGGRNYAVLQPREKAEFVNGFAVNPYKTQPGTYIPNPEAMLVPDGKGGMRVNQPLVDAKAAIAAAGRPSVSVTTGNTMASELGKGTGELLTAGRSAAESAASTVSMSNTIRTALDSGKVISGPGANVRLGVAQIASTLGLPVDDAGLKQTRVAIAGMANQALNARGTLKGQGQVSDFEGKLLERAKSGDISMTLPELQAFLDVNERLARAQIDKHNSLVTTLAKNPAYSEVIPFYSIEQPAQYQRAQPAANITPAEAAAELERRRRERGGS